MGDRWAAEIRIGGKITGATAQKLLPVVCAEGASLAYGDAAWQPTSVDELRDKRSEDGLLTLFNDQASWGEFDDLERFLRMNKVAFDRSSSGYYEYGAEIVQYRPSIGLQTWRTDGGTKLVPTEKILLAVQKFERSACRILKVDDFLRSLRRAIGPDVPGLEPFEVIPAPTRRRHAKQGD